MQLVMHVEVIGKCFSEGVYLIANALAVNRKESGKKNEHKHELLGAFGMPPGCPSRKPSLSLGRTKVFCLFKPG